MSDVIITVRGEHEARIAPERGVAHLSVRAEGRDRGGVVERVAAVAGPLRAELDERKGAGSVEEWSSQRVSVWASRPWNAEGKQLALIHYASVSFTAAFSDFAELSSWVGEIAGRDGVQIDGVEWRLTPETRRSSEADTAARAVGIAVTRATSYATALGLGSVTPLEVADLGLLGRPSPEASAHPPMLRAMAMADSGAAGPAIDFEPEDIVVTAAVEARFAAR